VASQHLLHVHERSPLTGTVMFFIKLSSIVHTRKYHVSMNDCYVFVFHNRFRLQKVIHFCQLTN